MNGEGEPEGIGRRRVSGGCWRHLRAYLLGGLSTSWFAFCGSFLVFSGGIGQLG